MTIGYNPRCDASAPHATRVSALVAALPTHALPSLLSNGNFGGAVGVPSLGLPAFNFAHEACHGLLMCNMCPTPECGASCPGGCCCDGACGAAATVFPQVIGLSSAFNKSLWHAVGAGISTQVTQNLVLYELILIFEHLVGENISRCPMSLKGLECPVSKLVTQ